MANYQYTVSCIYCEHFQYNPNTIEINPWKEEFCAITYKKRSPNDIICDFFELRSGIHTNKLYHKNNNKEREDSL